MKRNSHQSSPTVLSLVGQLFIATILVVVAIFISSAFGPAHSAKGVASVEVQFADGSASGLAIVPASCPSDPHYVGECSPAVCSSGLDINTYPSCVCPAGYTQSGSVCISNPTCPNGLDIRVYTTCLCPAGYVQSGSSCVIPPPLCSNGLNISTYPTCTCPVGYTQSGSSCIQTTPACPNGLNMALYPSCVCPVNYHQVGTMCQPDAGDPSGTGGASCSAQTGQSCTGLANICNMVNTGTIQCSGVCSATTPSDNLCAALCWDGSTPGAGGSCPACPTGYTAVGNTCVPPNSPQFVGFTTTAGFSASGHLEVRPSLVRSGDPTRVYWSVSNVRDCTVTGSNGDTWTALSSGASGRVTSAIVSRTDYTLFCHSLTGATPSTITETRTVNVLPSWYEPAGN